MLVLHRFPRYYTILQPPHSFHHPHFYYPLLWQHPLPRSGHPGIPDRPLPTHPFPHIFNRPTAIFAAPPPYPLSFRAIITLVTYSMPLRETLLYPRGVPPIAAYSL